MKDVRPKPKPRKHMLLWQTYLWWEEAVEMRKKHLLRISSAKRGKSTMSVDLERHMIDTLKLDGHVSPKNKGEREYSVFQLMVEEGQKVGPIWDWLISHKGIGESLAAQILAQVNDVEQFDTIAKLWRYCGYGLNPYWVDEKGKAVCPQEGWKWVTIKGERYRVWTVINGHFENEIHDNRSSADWDYENTTQYVAEKQYAIPQNKDLPLIERVDYLDPDPTWTLKTLSDRNCEGYHSPFNKKLKAIMWNVADSLRKQQTPGYVDFYYSEKERLRALHPEKIKKNGKWMYNDGHIDNMALRKMKKLFLKRLWLKWRELEGLPLTEEWKG